MAASSRTHASRWLAAPQTTPAWSMASAIAFLTGRPSGASSPLSGKSAPSFTVPTTCCAPSPPRVQPDRAIALIADPDLVGHGGKGQGHRPAEALTPAGHRDGGGHLVADRIDPRDRSVAAIRDP